MPTTHRTAQRLPSTPGESALHDCLAALEAQFASPDSPGPKR